MRLASTNEKVLQDRYCEFDDGVGGGSMMVPLARVERPIDPFEEVGVAITLVVKLYSVIFGGVDQNV